MGFDAVFKGLNKTFFYLETLNPILHSSHSTYRDKVHKGQKKNEIFVHKEKLQQSNIEISNYI
jgi:hypothetical protein